MKIITHELQPATFTAWGQFNGYPLKEIPSGIGVGLAIRLHKYALARLKESGFHIPTTWEIAVEVTTYPGDTPSGWTYHVTYNTPEGGQMGVQGIFVSRYGWPCLDHGLFIND